MSKNRISSWGGRRKPPKAFTEQGIYLLMTVLKLEKEVAALKKENELLRGRNFGGRRKHDEAWTASYNKFAAKYESGMSIKEIVAEGDISRRTAYRYLSYYRELQKSKDGSAGIDLQ